MVSLVTLAAGGSLGQRVERRRCSSSPAGGGRRRRAGRCARRRASLAARRRSPTRSTPSLASWSPIWLERRVRAGSRPSPGRGASRANGWNSSTRNQISAAGEHERQQRGAPHPPGVLLPGRGARRGDRPGRRCLPFGLAATFSKWLTRRVPDGTSCSSVSGPRSSSPPAPSPASASSSPSPSAPHGRHGSGSGVGLRDGTGPFPAASGAAACGRAVTDSGAGAIGAAVCLGLGRRRRLGSSATAAARSTVAARPTVTARRLRGRPARRAAATRRPRLRCALRGGARAPAARPRARSGVRSAMRRPEPSARVPATPRADAPRHASPRSPGPRALRERGREALVVQFAPEPAGSRCSRSANARVSAVWAESSPDSDSGSPTITRSASSSATSARRRPIPRREAGVEDRLQRRRHGSGRIADRASAAGAAVVEREHPHAHPVQRRLDRHPGGADRGRELLGVAATGARQRVAPAAAAADLARRHLDDLARPDARAARVPARRSRRGRPARRRRCRARSRRRRACP